MTAESNKAVVRRFYEAFAENDQVALNEVLSPNLAAYSHGPPGPQTRDVHLQGIAMWNAAFEVRFVVEEQVAEGDLVATRVTMHAVHNRGEWRGMPPTGKEIKVGGITIEYVQYGRIVERRVSSDWLGMLQQLGLVPAHDLAR